MARFVFRYESLLRARLIAEREAQRLLGEVLRERSAFEELAGACEAALRAEEEAGRAVGVVNSQQLCSTARRRAELAASQRGWLDRAAQLGPRIEGARRQLAKAMSARRAIERLREIELERWKQEQSRREQAELDDMASVHARTAEECAS